MHAPPGYEVRGPLGQGGMGVVYRAVQVKLNREVALKVIGGDGPLAPQTAARFLREAQALARVNHPNVVQIYDYGEADGAPYFAAEYCPGGNLRDRLQTTRYTPAEAVRLVIALAEALEAVHREGLIHRDVKPSNILFKKDDTPALGDFGIVRGPAGELTTPGVGIGTYGYMAPEQEAGHPNLTPAVDIYALGVVLHELLTGKLPRRGPKLPSTLSPRLCAICSLCLMEDPLARYQSAAALAADLRDLMETNEPGTVPLPSSCEERTPTAPSKRMPGPWLAVTCGIGVIGIIGVIAVLWLPPVPPFSKLPGPKGGQPPEDGPAARPPVPVGLLPESFARGVPAEWDIKGFRLGKDETDRAFLEPEGETEIKSLTQPRFVTIPLALGHPFALEMEYTIRGHDGAGWSGVRQEQLLTFVLSSKDRDVMIQANYEGQVALADRAPRKPPGHKPAEVTRMRVEHEGDVFRVFLDGTLAAGARLEGGERSIESLRIGLTPGLVTRLPAARPARLYSVAIKPLKVEPRPKASVFPITDDQKTVPFGDIPEGWEGPAFSLLRDPFGAACFEVTAPAGQHALRLPPQSLNGEFQFSFDFILHGHNGAGFSGIREEHRLSVEMKGPKVNFELGIDHEGNVTLNRSGRPLRPKVFLSGKLNRFRMVRRTGYITEVRINDDPVLHGGVAGESLVETITLGLTAGRITRTNADFARIYRVRLQAPSK